MERIDAKFVTYQNAVAGTEITDDFDVLNWFHKQQMKFPMLTRFAYIIHYVTPSQTENKRDLSLAGIYTASSRTNISVIMLSDLTLIDINRTDLGRNTPIDGFGGSLDSVVSIVDWM